MPGGFPLGLDVCNGTNIAANTGTSSGVALTSSASANTKGSFTQLIASTTIDACWMYVGIQGPGISTSVAGAVDIAVGGSGSEQVIVSNLCAGNVNDLGWSGEWSFPIQIPAGTRVAARCQTTVGSDGVAVNVILFDGSFTQMEGVAGVDSIGFLTASTHGTSVDPGGTANTKGSYAQLVASTSRDYLGLMLAVDQGPSTSTVNFPVWLLDIAIGGSGSEQVIIPNLAIATLNPSATAGVVGATEAFFPIAIPAGTRVAARLQCNITTAAQRELGITCYGLYL